MLQDARYAIRAFARTPGFTAAAVLSLALGIGANTAIFSVASALLLRPLPYQDADRLVILWNRSPGLGITEDWFSTAQYFDIKTGHHGFEQVAIAIGGNYNLTGDGEPERIGTIRVSSNLLPMLGARAALGRLFVAEEDVGRRRRPPPCSATARGCAATAAIRTSSARPSSLNGQPYQIVGVLPASFSLPREVMPTLGGAEHAEVVLPLPLGPKAAEFRNREDYNIIGDAEAGRDGRRGAGRDGRDHRAAAARSSRGLPAERRPDVRHRAAAGAGRRRRAPIAHRARRRGRLRAADRVRERREPAAVARARAPAGDRRPRGARRQPRAASSASS